MIIIIKGLALGTALFVAFTLIYFKACGVLSSTGAVGAEVLRAMTIGNYLYWTAAALLLAFGIVAVAIWPVQVTP